MKLLSCEDYTTFCHKKNSKTYKSYVRDNNNKNKIKMITILRVTYGIHTTILIWVFWGNRQQFGLNELIAKTIVEMENMGLLSMDISI